MPYCRLADCSDWNDLLRRSGLFRHCCARAVCRSLLNLFRRAVSALLPRVHRHHLYETWCRDDRYGDRDRSLRDE